MTNFNERILKEIARLRYLQEQDIKSDRITYSLEILRFVRNSELKLSFEEGIKEENEWISKNQ